MRLLLLTPDFPPARGGIQNLLERLARGLAGHHDVRVVTLQRSGDRAWDRAQPYRVTRALTLRLWPPTVALLALAAFVEIVRYRPGLIICGHIVLGPVCELTRRLFGTRYLMVGHGSEIRSARMRHVAGISLRGASCSITGSDFALKAMLSYGVSPSRVYLIRPGAGVETRAMKEPLVAAPDGRVLLSVSRLVERYKGHDMVIRAVPLIRAKIPDVHYVIVGDGPLRSYLERLASSLGVRNAVMFTGEVSDDAIESWYRRADVFILNSRESAVGGGAEGFGLVFVEANLRGTPVIGGRSGGIPDAVIDGVTGLLVDPLNIGDVADAVVRVLTDRSLATTLGENGRRRAIDELSWSKYVERFEDVIASVTHSPAARGT